MKSTSLQDWVINDFRQSAIPDDLMLANVVIIEGDEAVHEFLELPIAQLQRSKNWVSAQSARLIRRYGHVGRGGWMTRDGVPMFKPRFPRLASGFGKSDQKLKPVKYETPPGQPGEPFLPQPLIPYFKKTCDRYGLDFAQELTALEDRALSTGQNWKASRSAEIPKDIFWQWVIDNPLIDVVFTEGVKKALALMAYGVVAIALRGVTMWHPKGQDDRLYPCLEAVAGGGRKVHVVFDQDSKPKTIRDVQSQAKKLGAVIERCGARPHFPVWDPALGKGVDDVLYGQGDQAQSWLDLALQNALDLKQYRKDYWPGVAKNVIAKSNQLSCPIERDTAGEYLPELPALTPGTIHVISASMNAGKTTRMGQDLVNPLLASGAHVLVLNPRNALGQQSAKDWCVTHIHDMATRDEWEALRRRPAVVMCPDSVEKLPAWFFDKLLHLDNPLWLFIDEANQVTAHITQGDTFGVRYSELNEAIARVAALAIASGGGIILSEAGVPDRCVAFWQEISGTTAVRAFRHHKQGALWECTVYEGSLSRYRADMLETIGRGKRLLVVTTSQREARRLERVIRKKFGDSKKVFRVDSDTSDLDLYRNLFHDPDAWLYKHQPDVLILSPSAQSGLSIEGGVSAAGAYFDAVWGYFPALATDSHMQLLGRYRPPVPRHIFIPPSIQGSGDESLLFASRIKAQQQEKTAAITALLDVQGGDREPNRMEAAIAKYRAASLEVSGLQKMIARASLIDALTAAGHSVSEANCGSCKETAQLFKQVQDELWREDATELAAVQPEDGQDLEWAFQTLNSKSKREDRIIAQKVLLRDDFPGESFDDPETCYQAITKDWSRMQRGVKLQASAENLASVRASDSQIATAILNKSVRALHRLPKSAVQATMLNRLGVLEMLDGKPWSNSDERAIAIKAITLRFAKEIKYWLGLNINEEQSPVAIVNKLLRRLGLIAKVIASPGRRGEQERVWQIENLDDPIRVRLLEARRRKLSGDVLTISNRVPDTHIEIVSTGQNPPPDKGWNWAARLNDALNDARDLLSLACSIDNEAIAAVRQALDPDILAAIA